MHRSGYQRSDTMYFRKHIYISQMWFVSITPWDLDLKDKVYMDISLNANPEIWLFPKRGGLIKIYYSI
jgi:hypothetical protein